MPRRRRTRTPAAGDVQGVVVTVRADSTPVRARQLRRVGHPVRVRRGERTGPQRRTTALGNAPHDGVVAEVGRFESTPPGRRRVRRLRAVDTDEIWVRALRPETDVVGGDQRPPAFDDLGQHEHRTRFERLRQQLTAHTAARNRSCRGSSRSRPTTVATLRHHDKRAGHRRRPSPRVVDTESARRAHRQGNLTGERPDRIRTPSLARISLGAL